MDIKFSEIKEITLGSCKEFFEPRKFKFVKKDLSFVKKTPLTTIEVAFGFLNYYPLQCGFHFIIAITIEELEKEVVEFHKAISTEHSLKCNALILEGDFIEEVKDKEFKFRNGRYNIITSRMDLEVSLKEMFKRIEHYALPLAESITSSKLLTEYYLNNKEKLILNLASKEVWISVLTAAYLSDKSAYTELFTLLQSHLDFLSSQGDVWTEAIFYLKAINNYLLTKSSIS